jgi:hypothetical protein
MLRTEDLEALALFPTLREAYDEGRAKGAEQLFTSVLAEKMGRVPTADEQAGLGKRTAEVGSEQALRALVELHRDALIAWVLGGGSAPARDP